MWLHFVVLVVPVLLLKLVILSRAYKYEVFPEDDELFNECANESERVLNVTGLFDISELHFNAVSDRVTISGNTTSVWEIERNDRIESTMEIFQLDRGTWRPTVYRITLFDTCKILFDKNQHWYQGWLQYVTNFDEVKDKCFNVPGTKFIHRPFDSTFILDSTFGGLSSHCKVRFNFKAFNEQNEERPTSICMEIKVQLIRH